jgi:hypothetical protein
MDKNNQCFAGLGAELSTILQAINVGYLGAPLWSIKRTKDKVYLDLVWFETPAITASDSAPVQASVEPPPKLAQEKKKPEKKKKHKSPSSKRRDRKRLQEWKLKQREEQSKEIREFIESRKRLGIRSPGPVFPNPVVQPSKPDRVETEDTTVLDQQPPSPESQATTVPDSITTEEVKELLREEIRQLEGEENATTAQHTIYQSNHEQCEKQLHVSSTENIVHSESTGALCCYTCSKQENELAGRLRKCTRCSKAFYCDQQCQTKDWPHHKRLCRALAELCIQKP